VALSELHPQRARCCREPLLEVRQLGLLRGCRRPHGRGRRTRRLFRRGRGRRSLSRGLGGTYQPAQSAESAHATGSGGGRGGNCVVVRRRRWWLIFRRGLARAGRREGAGEAVEGGPEVSHGCVAALGELNRLLKA
jgi:hypothetical protein